MQYNTIYLSFTIGTTARLTKTLLGFLVQCYILSIGIILKDNPVHYAKNDEELHDAIKNQMRHDGCIPKLSRVYSNL